MNTKKLIAALLCVSVLAGISGCENGFLKRKKAAKAIEGIMEDFTDAVEDLDADSLIDLTDWDEDDRISLRIADCFDFSDYDGLQLDYYELFLSTVGIEYDMADLELSKDEAELKVEYSIINWEDVFNDLSKLGPEMDIRDVSAEEYGTKTIKGKITFELDKNTWRITQITKLDEVFSFKDEGPFIDEHDPYDPDPIGPGPVGPDPVGPDPVDPGIDLDAVYSEACRAYVSHLKEHEAEIKKAESIYHKNFVLLYDLDANGVLDLIYLSADDVKDDYSSASLHILTYNAEKKYVDEKIVVPEIAYMAEGGSFVIYVTQGAVVVNHTNGEEALQHVYTEVYSDYNPYVNTPSFDPMGTFRRDVYYDYDPATNTESFKYEYFFARDGENYNVCEEATYEESVGFLINNAIAVTGYDYLPIASDFEYPLTKISIFEFMSFDTAIETYKDY